MTYAEIIGLLAEMVLEDARQGAANEYELPYSLEELLRAFEYELQWKRNSPITLPQGGNHAIEHLATYAATLPADDSVNDPTVAAVAALAEFISGTRPLLP